MMQAKQCYKIGAIHETKAGRVFSAQREEDYVFVSIVEHEGHWTETTMSYELFERFCKEIGFPEILASEEVFNDICNLPVYTRECEVRGKWVQACEGGACCLEVVSLPYTRLGGEN